MNSSPSAYASLTFSTKREVLNLMKFGDTFPSLYGNPPKPPEAVDWTTVASFTLPNKQEVFRDDVKTPAGAALELVFTFCPSAHKKSDEPVIFVHNMRASYRNNDVIVNLIRKPEKTPHVFGSKLSTTLKTIEADLKEANIAEDELKQIWAPIKGDSKLFWSWGQIKHGWYCVSEPIPKYASTTYFLAKPFIKGGPNTPDNMGLGKYLHSKGVVAGAWHDVTYLVEVLEEFFGVRVYPRFHAQDQTTVLYEIVVLFDGSPPNNN